MSRESTTYAAPPPRHCEQSSTATSPPAPARSPIPPPTSDQRRRFSAANCVDSARSTSLFRLASPPGASSSPAPWPRRSASAQSSPEPQLRSPPSDHGSLHVRAPHMHSSWPGHGSDERTVRMLMYSRAADNPDRTRREDPPPLLADLDCAVRGSGPFPRVCLGSSATVSPPRHGSARHGPTSLRTGPSAGGAGSTAGLRRREMADANWPSWWSRLLMPVTCCLGYPAWPVRGAASQRAGPAISWIWPLTMARTTSPASGAAAVNR